MSMRWVRYVIPTTALDFAILGREPFIINEAPKGPFHEVTGATLQETGLFARKALPPTREGTE